MLGNLLIVLENGLQNIDIVINDRIRRIKSSSVQCGSWKLDESLKAIINNIKAYSDNISKTCVKLVLLTVNKNLTTEVIDSIAKELLELCQHTLETYFVFLEQSISDCLFDYVSRAVRILLLHVKDLVSAVSSSNRDSINMHAGMISKISDENQKLPLANRLAYRRYIMERCYGMKETIREFEEYVAEYDKSTLDTVFTGVESMSIQRAEGIETQQQQRETAVDRSDDDNEDDDDEEDEGEVDMQYTASEVALVGTCLELMRFCLDSTKTVLNVVTVVSDSVNNSSSSSSISSTESNPSQSAALLEQRCQVWVGALTRLTDKLQNCTVDLGAELYPPLDESSRTVIAELFNAQRQTVQDTLDLMEAEEFQSHMSDDVVSAITGLRKSFPSAM